MMNSQPDTPNHHGKLKTMGWVASIIGGLLYAYGYFAEGSVSLVAWSQYLPEWGVAFVPNLEAEVGFALSILGSIPLYYVEYVRR